MRSSIQHNPYQSVLKSAILLLCMSGTKAKDMEFELGVSLLRSRHSTLTRTRDVVRFGLGVGGEDWCWGGGS